MDSFGVLKWFLNFSVGAFLISIQYARKFKLLKSKESQFLEKILQPFVGFQLIKVRKLFNKFGF